MLAVETHNGHKDLYGDPVVCVPWVVQISVNLIFLL